MENKKLGSMLTKTKRLGLEESGLPKGAWNILSKLDTPQKIQNYINSLPFNFERKGETYRSVKRTLKEHEAHCFEGALIAAAALWVQGEKPLLLDLKSVEEDIDHVVTIFNRDGLWGAISKTNHGVLRYREPVYRTIRELVMSYFHEYFLGDGSKTLRSYSRPFDLRKCGTSWLVDDEELFSLVDKLDFSPHIEILSKKQINNLRKADKIEILAGGLTEWNKKMI